MIWTIVCFLITFYVLKKFAFGRIQHTIDERRKRIREALDEADRARTEAQKLVEEHRATMAQARGQAEEILAEARKVAESQRRRLRDELEEDRQRRLEETSRQIEAETARALQAIRSEVADLTVIATQKVTGKVLDAADHKRLIDEAIGELDFSALPGEPELGMAVVARTYARALFEAAQNEGRIEPVRDELATFVQAVDEVPELRALIRNPELDPPTKAAALDAVLEGADELVRNFVRVVAEKGRAAQLDEILREYEALVAAEEHILNVELTTAYELSDDDAVAIVQQIEKASGRRVEAARTVDPDLIGGLVLKAGSLEVDSSVRGRLERLRRDLAHAST